MKNSPLLIILSITLFTQITVAYENSFHNNTNYPIGIAIQYMGVDGSEPLYKQLIKPQSTYTFIPGEKGIPEIKWSFCLDTIYYIKNPTPEEKAHNFQKAFWKKIPITWVQKNNTPPQEPILPAQKSPCQKQHFTITENEHEHIVISSQLH